jgi:outer membrane lipoprotein carrier protein
MKIRGTAFLFILLLCASRALAVDISSVTDNIQRKYQSLNSFTADFTQMLTNATSKEKSTRTGTIVFAKPALIRWETLTPEKELLVVGRNAAWNAFPGEKNVFLYPVEQVLGSKTMLRFLSGKGNLREDFRLKEEEGAPEGQIALTLVPNQADASLVLAHVWVDAKTFLLTRISIEDFYGNINDVRLQNVKVNASVSNSLFQYDPPKDYTIFDNTEQPIK